MKRRVLVIDDDEAIVDAIQSMLEIAGYAVITSSDGKILHSIKSDFPDVILLDIWLSGMDGRNLFQYIKQEERLRDIPVIMISANRDVAKIAKESGVNDFLTKPFEMTDLLDKIAKYAHT